MSNQLRLMSAEIRLTSDDTGPLLEITDGKTVVEVELSEEFAEQLVDAAIDHGFAELDA